MTDRKLCLDLFSGLGGFSQAFVESGDWEVVTVDMEERFEPDICADVMDLHPSDLLDVLEGWDVLVTLVGFPCTYFTTIRNCTKGGDDAWTVDGRPNTAGARKHLAMLYHTLGLVRALAPDYWWLENPRGMLRKSFREPQGTVWYCQYGADHAKPTDLWGHHPATFEYRTCSYGNDACGHVRTESYREHGVGPDTWACPVCEAERVYGWTELPDPDALRRRSEQLERLGDEVENSELGARMEVSR